MDKKVQQMLIQLDEKYQSLFCRRNKLVFISVFVWGLITHGYMLLNKFCWSDETINYVYYGATFQLGRWMLGILSHWSHLLFYNTLSLPWFNGLGCFFCIAIATCLLVDLFQVKKNSSIMLISAVMTTTPTMVSLFSYMFTSLPYMIGMTMAVCGTWLIAKKGFHISRMVIGTILIACGIGVYQAWLPLAMSIFVLHFFALLYSSEECKWIIFFQKGIYYLGSCILSLLIYLGINSYFLYSKNVEMIDHAGMNNYGMVDITEYLKRVLGAYNYFFRPVRGFYPDPITKVYKIMLLLAMLLLFRQLFEIWKDSKQKMLQMLIVIGLFPLAVCFINVLSGDPFVLVDYPYNMAYILFIWLLEQYAVEDEIKRIWKRRICLGLVLCMCIWFVRYANATYLKAQYSHDRAKTYFTNMIARIQSVEGYSEEMPIAFINNTFSQKSVTHTPQFDEYTIVPYTFINDYSWEGFLREVCGFSWISADSDVISIIERSDEVENMQCYPNDGSIQVINNTVVIKLSE